MGCLRLTYKNENFLKVAYSKKEESASKNAIDYFSGGMAMPSRQIVGGEPYRYGYQGEFAETDPETGKPAFQLRLYDPRINRWISPDPMAQYPSPYMAMDNRWNMSVDPTGGCTDCSECPSACSDLGIESIPSGQSIDFDFDADNYVMLDNLASSLGSEGFISVGLNPNFSGCMAYVNVKGGTNHSFLLNPVTGDYWEASHPVDDDGNVTHGFISWASGDDKSIIRKRNLSDGDFWTFDSAGKRRGDIEVYFVYIPDKGEAIRYANNSVGSYPYSFTSQNCKHFVIDAMMAGHADVPWSTALPREFTKPGQDFWNATTPPDLEISNPLPEN